MERHSIKSAKRHLEAVRHIVCENPSPIFKMDREETIKTLRKTREHIWKKKLAPHS